MLKDIELQEDLLYHPYGLKNQTPDNWHLYLEYQRLNDLWFRVEERECSEDTKEILKIISDKQLEILSKIKIN